MLTMCSVLRGSGSALLAQASWQPLSSSSAKSDLTGLQVLKSSHRAVGNPSALLAGTTSGFPAGKDSDPPAGSPSNLLAGTTSDFPAGKDSDPPAARSSDLLAGSESGSYDTPEPCAEDKQVPCTMSILLVSVEHLQQWLSGHKVGSAAMLLCCVRLCSKQCLCYAYTHDTTTEWHIPHAQPKPDCQMSWHAEVQTPAHAGCTGCCSDQA